MYKNWFGTLEVRDHIGDVFVEAKEMLKWILKKCLSQWSRGLRRGFAAARLLWLRVRIPPRAWMSVSCECCVLSGRGLCDGLITHPEQSYRLWCVVVCDLETSWMRRSWPSLGRRDTGVKNGRNSVEVWTGLFLLRIGSKCGLSWKQLWNFRFCKIWGFSRPAENILAF